MWTRCPRHTPGYVTFSGRLPATVGPLRRYCGTGWWRKVHPCWWRGQGEDNCPPACTWRVYSWRFDTDSWGSALVGHSDRSTDSWIDAHFVSAQHQPLQFKLYDWLLHTLNVLCINTKWTTSNYITECYIYICYIKRKRTTSNYITKKWTASNYITECYICYIKRKRTTSNYITKKWTTSSYITDGYVHGTYFIYIDTKSTTSNYIDDCHIYNAVTGWLNSFLISLPAGRIGPYWISASLVRMCLGCYVGSYVTEVLLWTSLRYHIWGGSIDRPILLTHSV